MTARQLLRPALLALSATLLACPAPPSAEDGGTGEEGQPPELLSITPASGPQAGGTYVTVNGANLLEGARLYFGTGEASQVVLSSRAKLTARTPAVASVGPVDVRLVNPDGRSATLERAFLYEADIPRTIDEALVLNEPVATYITGANPVRATVVADVSIPGTTTGLGQGAGVRAQVGFAATLSDPPVASDFTWSDAAYLDDADGPVLGDNARDRYRGQLPLAGATGADSKSYFLAARFSIDEGNTWVLADRDGLSNGFAADKLPTLTVIRPTVDWCKLGGPLVEAPPNERLKLGQPELAVRSQVYHLGVTDQPGPGPNIAAELGYGAPGTDPSTWTWLAAPYSGDTSGGANDEYLANLPNPGEGVWAFAFRYSIEGGPLRYCDADGSDAPGFTQDQAGTLTVTPVGLDRCKLQGPASAFAIAGAATPSFSGRVFAQTVTDGAGQGANIIAELGYGPVGSQPSSAGWTWTSAAYDSDQDLALSDQYLGAFSGLPSGTYDVAYRFRYGTDPFAYCDLDGSENGYSPQAAARLQVSPLGCRLASVDQTQVESGGAVVALARVKVPGVTDGAGPGAGIRGQAGVGTQGDDASASPAWGWKEAAYLGDVGTEDEYRVELRPAYTGTRAVSFRFTLDDGASWTYCDLDGTEVGGYEPAKQHALSVQPHATFDWCNLQFPTTLSQPAGGSTLVYGQVFEPGLTPNAAASITAELGYGKKVEDPGLAWTWLPATFNVTVGNNNEYQAPFSGAPAGSYHYAFRFSTPGGSYCYGDLDGSGGTMGFNGEKSDGSENLGAATVSP